jgi:hypothetical protein
LLCHRFVFSFRLNLWETQMPIRARVNKFIAVVESGGHAGAIERYYTEDASMQENTAPPRVGRDGWWRMSAAF